VRVQHLLQGAAQHRHHARVAHAPRQVVGAPGLPPGPAAQRLRSSARPGGFARLRIAREAQQRGATRRGACSVRWGLGLPAAARLAWLGAAGDASLRQWGELHRRRVREGEVVGSGYSAERGA
jgi:hypothetical protein